MKKKMTAWAPGVGASGRQSIIVIYTHSYHIRMTFHLQWIFSGSRFTHRNAHRNDVTKGGGIMTCSEDCSNSI